MADSEDRANELVTTGNDIESETKVLALVVREIATVALEPEDVELCCNNINIFIYKQISICFVRIKFLIPT